MKRNQSVAVLLAFMLLFGCSLVPTAANTPDNNIAMPLATGRLNHELPANLLIPISQPISLAKDETVSYNCTYTPKSASVDFGYIAPDGLFYSLNCTSGSINKSIKTSQSGQYTLAIRNNESYAVTVTGTVKY